MNVPEEFRYSAEHEWVRVESNEAVVGITDYAQDNLNDVVYVSLPQVNEVLERGGSCGELESTKSVSDVYSPLSGKVVAVNLALEDQPELVNRDPYGDGWLFRLAIGDLAELEELMDADSYRALISE